MTVALGAANNLPVVSLLALSSVASGTAAIVLCAIIYARITGRHYPLKVFGEQNINKTTDALAVERLWLSEEELTNILTRYRQSFNLGVQDLARLIGAAEIQAASHHLEPQTAGRIMSRDLVTVSPKTSIADIANLFVLHASHRLRPWRKQYLRWVYLPTTSDFRKLFQSSKKWFLNPFKPNDAAAKSRQLRASNIMDASPVTATEETPLSSLVHQLSASGLDAVAILEEKRL